MTNKTQLYQPNQDLQLSKNLYSTSINGLFFIDYKKYHDERGFFTEFAKIPEIESLIGEKFTIKQVNFSYSTTNVVRGMHAENWNKLVNVVSGVAFCALADIRPESPTFGKKEYFKFSIDEKNGSLSGGLFISRGIANSICAIEGPVGYIYGVDQLYEERDTAGDRAISIFDPDLDIEWPISKEDMVVSQRDIDAISLKEVIAK